jgi:hypothetical protein
MYVAKAAQSEVFQKLAADPPGANNQDFAFMNCLVQ